MRAKEFITEQQLSHVHDALEVVARSLPYTYVIPDLKNQDFYELYRFGVAIADVRGTSVDDKLNQYKPNFRAESSWGENQVISSFDKDIGNVIDKALTKVNKHGKKMVSTPGSNEFDDTNKNSPLKGFKGYKK